jgi:hypothetical protein
MEEEMLGELERGRLRCSRCGRIIPFTFKKKDPKQEFTIPSFTIVESKPVCYSCYHQKELA